MSYRAPRYLEDIALAVLSLLIGAGCIYAFATMSSTWWNARSFQAVQGEVVRAEMVKHSYRRGTRYTPTVAYNYAVDGASYIGTNLSLGWFPGVSAWREEQVLNTLKVGDPITVWMNPRQPRQSVLYRDFAWLSGLGWFFVAQYAVFFFCGFFRQYPTVSEGQMISPAPESRSGFLLILLGNLMVLPLVVIAVFEFKFWPILTVFSMVMLGLSFVIFKYHAIRRRWQLGPPMFTDASDGSTMSTARFIFSPRYGARLTGNRVHPEASLAFEQVMYRRVKDQERLETVQTGSMGTVRMEFGVRSVDFTAQLPRWPTASNLRPAYWELALNIAGALLIYRIEPGFEH